MSVRRSPRSAVLLLVAISALGSSQARAQGGNFSFILGGGYGGIAYEPYFGPSQETLSIQQYSENHAAAFNSQLQAQLSANQFQPLSANTGAYWNHLRDNSGGQSFDVNTRRSLADRAWIPRSSASRSPTPAPVPQPRVATAVPPGTRVRIDMLFLPNGDLDWPRDAPATGDLENRRESASQLVKKLHDQVKTGVTADVASVVLAKKALIGYGQPALQAVRDHRSRTIADLFHAYLLSLFDALDQIAEPST